MSDEIAFVLRDDAAATLEPVAFGGLFPGVWVREKPIPLDDLGMTLTDARAAISDHNLPLDEIHKGRRKSAAARRTSESEGPGDIPPTGERQDPTGGEE